jgi:uncharacterized protein YaaR (DUF327 family)
MIEEIKQTMTSNSERRNKLFDELSKTSEILKNDPTVENLLNHKSAILILKTHLSSETSFLRLAEPKLIITLKCTRLTKKRVLKGL